MPGFFEAFETLSDRPVFVHFQKLVQTARPSMQEAQVQGQIAEWGESQGFRVTRDKTGNICLHVPARGETQNQNPVIIQNHTDIVVSNADDAPDGVDSATGNIPVDRGNVGPDGAFHPDQQGAWLRAPFTTLGADNGIGCAMAMAICDDPDAVHPPLELIFTVDEEQGLTGALQLDAEALEIRGRTLINLDTEDDDELTIGCAGGMDTEITWQRERRAIPKDLAAFEIALGPTMGGHSGIEIDAGRVNANRALARILRHAALQTELHLASIVGGDKRNAIPRTASAVVVIDPADEDKLRSAVDDVRTHLAKQFSSRDVDLNQAIADPKAVALPDTAFLPQCTLHLIDMLLALPAGVLGTTPEIPGLVETSNNLAVLQTEGDTVRIACNSRSSSVEALRDVSATLCAAAGLADATAKKTNQYPGWQPDVNSSLVKLTASAYEELFGESPKVHAIHAGLECGVLAERIGGDVDSISFGPNIRGNHAPGERVEIESVEKSYRLLKALLRSLAEQGSP
ncbi:beta-Ala-His dipeptidase [Thalassoroseus pseudoceratinae]|uniref:beta-Ala-His dipeptidase n=1 Tax=Thalassoroseus pseudoceratinae TaxID=2713176 RepID=UPI001420E681|nr:beta-Ala-His dipeptidase [Thalassoroseus pseudoceratinae]